MARVTDFECPFYPDFEVWHPNRLRMETNMKSIRPHIHCCALSLSLLAPTFGGEEDFVHLPEEAIKLPTGEPDAFEWLTPSLDIRTRYEFREQEPLDSANSFTARARVGLTLGTFNGFSAFGELEATAALNNDFDAGPGNTSPNNIGQTAIADPENVELNRAWIQYKKDGILAKVGRQRIIRNDAFHIGNVGWRQNEQTFDAAQVAYDNDDFNIAYVFSNGAQRIFGDNAGGFAEEFEGDFHFIDATYKSSIGDLGAYAYLIDVDNNTNVGESNTVGVFGNFGPVYLEASYQDGTSSLVDGIVGGAQEDYDAFLVRGRYTLKTEAGAFSAGIDWAQEDYKTPFQTAHAPFGYADAFLAQQIGLNKNGNFTGIFDAYLKYAKKGLPGGITFKADLHYFADEDLGTTYGYEADIVLVKKFTDNLTGLIKGAYFFADGSGDFNDIRQITVDLSYKY